MGIFENFKNIFIKKETVKSLVELRQEAYKTPTRIAQEKKLEDYTKIANRINNSGFELLLKNVRMKMQSNPEMTFESEFVQIKDYINNNLTDKDRFLLMNKTYKFSKSNYSMTKYFAESHWYEYNEKQGYACDNNKPLSVTTNREKILLCAMYGDQLTIFENNPNSMFYEQLRNANIKDIGTMFSEYQSSFLIIDKNLSLSDPYVLKSLIKMSDNFTLYDYFSRTINNKTFDEIYDDIGFSETANFYRKAKYFFKEYGLKFKEKLDEILPDKEKSEMLDMYIASKTFNNINNHNINNYDIIKNENR